MEFVDPQGNSRNESGYTFKRHPEDDIFHYNKANIFKRFILARLL